MRVSALGVEYKYWHRVTLAFLVYKKATYHPNLCIQGESYILREWATCVERVRKLHRKMGNQTPCEKLYLGLKKVKPYLAMVSLQFGYAGMYIITMVSLKHGMSHYILAVYRHVVATIVIAPFALVLERSISPTSLHDRLTFATLLNSNRYLFPLFFWQETKAKVDAPNFP